MMAYIASGERAEEHRSSAYVLLLVGGIGFVLIVLFFFDLLPFRMGGFNKYMVSGVMGALFVLFLVMGFISMKNSRILAIRAGKEENLTKEISNWCRENLDGEAIDREIMQADEGEEEYDDELGDEVKYFRRFERINEILSKQFLNLDEGYLAGVIDDVYEEIFNINAHGRAD
jgi:hypothetical protein